MAHMHKTRRLTKVQRAYMQELGISLDSLDLYELLLREGELTAHDASKHLGKYSSAEYRLFYRLEALGFVRSISGRPRRFQAVSFANAANTALSLRQQEMHRMLDTALGVSNGDTGGVVRLLMGRQAMYDEYVRLAPTALRSLDAFTIGIAHSTALVATQQAMIARGVQVRIAVQQVKLSNYYVVRTWQKLGMEVRVHSAERGIHLMIFDDHTVLVSFSDPSNTEDRVSLVLESPAAVAMFKQYFAVVWSESREIGG